MFGACLEATGGYRGLQEATGRLQVGIRPRPLWLTAGGRGFPSDVIKMQYISKIVQFEGFKII